MENRRTIANTAERGIEHAHVAAQTSIKHRNAPVKRTALSCISFNKPHSLTHSAPAHRQTCETHAKQLLQQSERLFLRETKKLHWRRVSSRKKINNSRSEQSCWRRRPLHKSRCEPNPTALLRCNEVARPKARRHRRLTI